MQKYVPFVMEQENIKSQVIIPLLTLMQVKKSVMGVVVLDG